MYHSAWGFRHLRHQRKALDLFKESEQMTKNRVVDKISDGIVGELAASQIYDA